MPAKRLYYDQPYLKEWSARVVGRGTGPSGAWVKLDATAFYPTSGGQPNDLGEIGGSRVVDIIEEDGDIIHFVEHLPEGEEVECKIDWDRRFDFMQQHTGQHILSSAFEKLLDADTVGFHLTERSLTIDLNIAGFDEARAAEVEMLANQIIYEDRPICSVWPSDEELKEMPLRKPPARADGIRVIVIEGFDWSACGGTHPSSTGQIGIIKILGWEKVRAGTRVFFACGKRALLDYAEKNRAVKTLSSLLSVPLAELDQAVRKLVDQVTTQHKRIESLSKQLTEFESQALVSSGERVIARYYPVREIAELRMLASIVVSYPGRIVVLGASEPSPQVMVARSDDLAIDARQLVEVAKAVLGGRGGGNPKFAQSGGPDGSRVESAISKTADAARKALGL